MMNDQQLRELGVYIVHHMPDDGSGVYIKETRMAAGSLLSMHAHTFTHKSTLAAGRVVLTKNGECTEIEAPAVLILKAGDAHQVEAVTPAVWLCIHASTETDLEKIDHTLVGA